MSGETGKPNEKRKVNAENWRGHEDRINQIFSLYESKVNGLVSVYNSVTGEFPAGVLNELRDIFAHMTQSLMTDDPEKVEHQLERAQAHCKRAAVDGFKYAVTAYSEIYEDFEEKYKDVDLSYVDGGRLLPRLIKQSTAAGQAMTEARLVESGVHTDDQMYKAYEEAYNRFTELYVSVMDALDVAEPLKLKAEKERAVREKEKRTDRMIGIIGIVFGIVGSITGLVGILLTLLTLLT